jgi:23S rRNA pseudouridine1911/1915/1917 synthase
MKKSRNRFSADKNKKIKKMVDVFTIDKNDTLLSCLISRLPQKSRSTLKAVLRDRQVSVDGIPVTQFDHDLIPGQRLEVRWDRSTPQQKSHGLKIIYEDQDLIIIDKPTGLLTIATDKEKRNTAYSFLSDYVKTADPDNKIFIIHRLDRETSGLLMFAKNKTVKQQIQKTWTSTISQRTYIAVVEGELKKTEGTVISWLTESKAFIVYSSQNHKLGRKAITHYKKIRGNSEFSLLQVHLETGRKHQIRVHMQDINHPILGDKKYGSGLNPIRRMGLHSQVLAFTHPRTGEACRFETPIPKKFWKLFSSREKAKK